MGRSGFNGNEQTLAFLKRHGFGVGLGVRLD